MKIKLLEAFESSLTLGHFANIYKNTTHDCTWKKCITNFKDWRHFGYLFVAFPEGPADLQVDLQNAKVRGKLGPPPRLTNQWLAGKFLMMNEDVYVFPIKK